MVKICNYPLEYFIYIIIFILVLTIIINLIKNNTKNNIENFDNSTKLKEELNKYKNELTLSEMKQSKLNTEIDIIKNYTKINDNDLNNLKNYAFKTYFNNSASNISPLKNNITINNNNDLITLLYKSKNQKNIYKVGDKVLQDPTFYISKNDICYNNVPLNEIHLYSGCSVCSVNPSNKYISNKTKTNIESVCLYNDNKNKKDKNIPTSSQCANLCIGRT